MTSTPASAAGPSKPSRPQTVFPDPSPIELGTFRSILPDVDDLLRLFGSLSSTDDAVDAVTPKVSYAPPQRCTLPFLRRGVG